MTATDPVLAWAKNLDNAEFWSRLRRAFVQNERTIDRFNGTIRALLTEERLADTHRGHSAEELDWFMERKRREKHPIRCYRVAPLGLLAGYLWHTSKDEALYRHPEGPSLHVMTAVVDLYHVILRIQDGRRKAIVVFPELVKVIKTELLETV